MWFGGVIQAILNTPLAQALQRGPCLFANEVVYRLSEVFVVGVYGQIEIMQHLEKNLFFICGNLPSLHGFRKAPSGAGAGTPFPTHLGLKEFPHRLEGAFEALNGSISNDGRSQGFLQHFSESSQRLTESGKALLHLLPRCHSFASLRMCSRKSGSRTSRKSTKSTTRRKGTSSARARLKRARVPGVSGGSHHSPMSISEPPVASPRAKEPNRKTRHLSGGMCRKMTSRIARFHLAGREIR